MRLRVSAALRFALKTMRPVRVLAMVGVCAAALGAQPASAQTNAPAFFSKVEFSGLVDAYYTYNFNEPQTGAFTPLRNFDVKHNQFSVSLLEFAMAKPAVKDDRDRLPLRPAVRAGRRRSSTATRSTTTTW